MTHGAALNTAVVILTHSKTLQLFAWTQHIHGTAFNVTAIIPIHPATWQLFVQTCPTHGAVSVIANNIHIRSILAMHMQIRNQIYTRVTRILIHLNSVHNHIQGHIHIHHQRLFISFKLFDIPTVSCLQNQKLQK